jgi:hypothetical protein
MEVSWVSVDQHLDWLTGRIRPVPLTALRLHIGDRVKEVWCSPPQNSAACGEALAANVKVNGICWIDEHGVDSRHCTVQLSCLMQKSATAVTNPANAWPRSAGVRVATPLPFHVEKTAARITVT